MAGCQYFELYDPEGETWTEWGEAVRRVMPYDLSNAGFGNFEWITDHLDTDPNSAAETFCERYGIPRYDEGPDAFTDEFSSRSTYQYELLATKVFLAEYDIGPCPHEVVGDTDYCVFHLPTERKDELGIEPEAVQQELLAVVNATDREEAARSGTPMNYFAGAQFRELNLSRGILNSDSNNYPINLNFADIDRLVLADAEISQGLQLDYATVREADLERADIRMDASFENATFRGPVNFRHVTVSEGEVSFESATFDPVGPTGSAVCFENATFGGREINFKDVDCRATEATFRGVDFAGRRTIFNGASFGCDVTFKHSEFTGEQTEFRGVEFGGSVNFISTRFDDRETDFFNVTVGGSALFRNATFAHATDFKKATFERGVRFDGASFSDHELVFTDAECGGEAWFEGASFEGGADFSGTVFAERLDLSHTYHRGRRTDLSDVAFGGAVAFEDAAFEGGVDLDGAVFHRDVDFSEVDFGGQRSRFRETTFEGPATFENATFGTGADFEGARFESGDAADRPDFTLAEHVSGVMRFAGTRFEDGARFERARFRGREVDFSGAEFEGPVDVEGAPVTFEDCTFETDRAVYDGATFWYADVSFDGSSFTNCVVSFADVRFRGSGMAPQRPMFDEITVTGGELRMVRAGVTRERLTVTDLGQRFHELGFPERRIGERIRAAEDVSVPDISPDAGPGTGDEGDRSYPVDIRGVLDDYPLDEEDPLLEGSLLTVLEEGGWIRVDDLNGMSAPVEAAPERERTAAEATLALVCDPDVTLGDEDVRLRVRVVEALVRRGLVRRTHAESEEPVRLNGARIEAGDFWQPGVGPDDYDEDGLTTVYEFRGSHVGEVRLRGREPQTVFRCHAFLDTTFDGFEFNNHKEELRNDQWTLHRTVHDGEPTLPVHKRVLKRLFLSSPVTGDLDGAAAARALESTYLKAKNGADRVGDNNVASAFFQKELQHRRRYHRAQIAASVSGVRALYSYVANLLLGLTSGYGERPGRVIAFSAFVIAMFGVGFQFAWRIRPTTRPEQYSHLSGAMQLSFESFTTLVLGGGNLDNVWVRNIAYVEGFIGAFLIALFVFTLTRSVHR